MNKDTIKQIAGGVMSFLIFVALYLLGSNGTISWRVLLFFVLYFGYALVTVLLVLSREPELIRGRVNFGKVEGWDKAILVIFAILVFAMFYGAGVDAASGISYFPGAYLALGIFIFLLGGSLITWSVYVNKFFESGARIQRDRKQVVITSGPYAIVRHPGYIGMILFFSSFGLILGSIIATIISMFLIVLLIIRTYLEDAMLYRGLKGYKAYSKKVRYRLVPGLW